MNSGTSALVCGLAGLEIGPGDEVIVPAYTWVSTLTAVMAVGAVPVVAEVDESLTLDPADARGRITPRTRAIVPVHMRGAPAAMDGSAALAGEHGLRVLEDVAQAAGASFRGRRLGASATRAPSASRWQGHHRRRGRHARDGRPGVHRRAAMYHDSGAMPHMGVPADEWLPGLNLRMAELQAAVCPCSSDGSTRSTRARARKRRRAPVEPRLRERGATLRAARPRRAMPGRR